VVLDRCNFVALVTEPDPIALRCAKGRLALLQRWGIMGELMGVVVVNRWPSVMTRTVGELRELLGVTIVGVVPPAPEACLHALQQSAPLLLIHPDHLAARMLQEVAQRLAGEHPAALLY
jgi:Flp pilus assembly CpaE family ATPase